MTKPRVIAILPARYGSSRFPGKPLAMISGKPMIQWTYENTLKCKELDDVVVATDDERIVDAVKSFGGHVVMTSKDHPTGTDRIAEAARSQAETPDLIVNVQGDEPLIPPTVLSQLIKAMFETGADMGTAAVPFSRTDRDPADPNAVKVIVDNRSFAIYFSRLPIPYLRQGGTNVEPMLHWGLYAYTYTFLNNFVSWERGKLEQCEMLEQLRALENGARIWVLQTNERSTGVDVPEDIEYVEKMLANQG